MVCCGGVGREREVIGDRRCGENEGRIWRIGGENKLPLPCRGGVMRLVVEVWGERGENWVRGGVRRGGNKLPLQPREESPGGLKVREE